MDDAELDDFDDEPDGPPQTAQAVAIGLARAFLAGEGSPAAMRERGERALGQAWPWLVPLALRLHFDCGPPLGMVWPAERHDEVVAGILAFPPFLAAFAHGVQRPGLRRYYPYHAPMGMPPPPLRGVGVPALATPGDLADWLGLTLTQLDWFAGRLGGDAKASAPKFEHYRCRWLAKPCGGLRLIEAPKEELRHIQRRILREILNRVPVHPAAQGCVRGRSVLGNARLHTGSPLLIKLDLEDFFASIASRRVHALFRTLGYPVATARYLTALTTQRTPMRVLRQMPHEEAATTEARHRRRLWAQRFLDSHLPQGAPTSPALANLCAYRLDLRLSGAAAECRARYSRYVDDIVFSCPEADVAHGRRILAMLQEIVREEGFVPNRRKTRLASASTTQRVTGIVVNAHPNLPRHEFDRLKATLTNCRRHGPASQNRQGLLDFRAHLQGRIAWWRQVNPARATKLQALFDQVDWDA